MVSSRKLVSFDVVIPARLEGDTLARCLSTLIPQLGEHNSRLIVVCNGEDAHERAESVRSELQHSCNGDWESVVCATEEAGKANALNVGDMHTRGGAVMYLDADVALSPSAISATLQRLCETEAPRMSSPRMDVAPPGSWIARHYSRVWVTLPAVFDDVVGAGCYAVNAAGRRRWAQFPAAYPDDAFVRSRFSQSERILASEASFRITMPEGADLVRVVERWASGNALLAKEATDFKGAAARVGATRSHNLRHLVSKPSLWASVPAFVLVWMLARLRRKPFDPKWRPIRTRQQPASRS